MKKIKTISTFVTTLDTSDEERLVRFVEHDEAGQVLLEELYHPDGSVESRIERTYNAEGRLESEKTFATDLEKPDQEMRYTYSAAGRIELASIHYQDGSITYRRYEHDEANNSETIHIEDENGVMEGKEYRRLDTEGKVLEEIIHNEDNELEQHLQQEYDEHGLILKRTTVFADDYKTVEIFHYERNDKGLILERATEDEEEELLRLDEFVYDEKGNTIEHRVQDYNQGWSVIDRQEYDEKDQIIKTQRLKADGSVAQEIDFVYDENGHLLEQENRSPQGIHLLQNRYEFY